MLFRSSEDDRNSYLRSIQERMYGKKQEDILKDSKAIAMLREIGPDQNILCYAFNFKRQDNRINDDPELFELVSSQMMHGP